MGLNRVNEDFADLDEFVQTGALSEVLGVVKSGKEATVYCARGGRPLKGRLVAAKVYRSMKVRQFANAATYNAGRLRGADGYKAKRETRAIMTRTKFGRELAFGKWVADEFATLQLLQRGGVSVPEPLLASDRIILMEYIGDGEEPAPSLQQTDLDAAEAAAVFGSIMQDVERMLACDRVHGDLSPYNVLYQDGRARVIDVPQTVDARFNPNALALLERDVGNMCAYFSRYGVRADGWRIAHDLWGRYLRADL